MSTARDVFASMSNAAKDDPMARFLMYKVAIRCEDFALASECLQVISSSSNDPTLLYACVLDAKELDKKDQILATMHLILEKYGYEASSGIHLPSLLRLTIGLATGLLRDTTHQQDDDAADPMVERLCKLYEGGEDFF
jgi:hypothetical protein